eukprot:TRINITY_DN65465_c0_g1_i1.p1 TRINITY_DN65465_c0_g1~~TRINITY_DN65465_c0_g1_i1.p1  ORF type:complete len:334 (-),score=77.68 TRINITY_DN65465_c0_g1_i1:85-1086(-)
MSKGFAMLRLPVAVLALSFSALVPEANCVVLLGRPDSRRGSPELRNLHQARPHRPARRQDSSVVEKGPANMVMKRLEKVDASAAELESTLKELETSDAQELSKLEAQHTRELTALKTGIHALEKDKETISSEIKRKQRTVRHLRQEAAKYMELNKGLLNKLRNLKENISTAMEFVNSTATQAASLTLLAEPLLKELEAEDRQREEALAEERALDQVRNAGEALALLQTDGDDKDWFASLSSALTSASLEQNKTATRLESAFHQKFSELSARKNALTKKNAELSEKLAVERSHVEKVTNALTSLKQTNHQMQLRYDSLRNYIKEMSAPPERLVR